MAGMFPASKMSDAGEQGRTYGADMPSSFLLRMGSDMMTIGCRVCGWCGVVEKVRRLLVSPRRFKSAELFGGSSEGN